MRKRLFLVLTILALLLVPGVVSATSQHDFVTGAGKHAGGVQFTISAHSGPLGEDPKGNFSFKIEGQPRVRAGVTCLIVSGNQAIATGTFIDPQTNTSQLVVMHAVDNGEPSDPVPDLLRFSFTGGIVADPNNPGCFLPIFPPVPVTQGNIVVNDGQP